MPDFLSTIGGAAKSLFRYAAGSGISSSFSSGLLSAASPSNTAWLFNGTPQQRAQQGVSSSSQLTSSSIFIIALNFQIDSFNAAPPVVERWQKPDGLNPRWVPDYNHAAGHLLCYPNPVLQTGRQLFGGILCDLKFDANSYIAKERNLLLEPMGLHWAPWYQWEIVTTPEDAARGVGISYYLRHSGKGPPEKYFPEDIIHIKGPKPDPQDPRRGWNDSAAFFREASTDIQRAEFSYWILKNKAVADGIIGPDNGDDEWDEDTAQKFGTQWASQHGNENVGKIHIATQPYRFTPLNHNPQEMALEFMAKVPESRIAGWFKLPPGVLHYLVGLERNTDCLPADARVWTPSGSERIVDIKPGRIVWAYNEGRVEPRRVLGLHCAGHKQLFEIKTKNRTLRASANHPLLVRVNPHSRERVKLVWKPISELKVGDSIVQPKSLPDQGITTLPDGTKATPEMLQFMGAFVGDGNYAGGRFADAGLILCMPKQDRVRAHYEKLATSLFRKYVSGYRGQVTNRIADGSSEKMAEMRDGGATLDAIGKSFGVTKASVRDRIETARRTPETFQPIMMGPVVISESRNGFRVSTANGAKWMLGLGFGRGAHQKRVPQWIYSLNRELRLAFLAGIVDSDGYVDSRGAMTVSLCNKNLVHDIRDLTISVGIQCCNVRKQAQPERSIEGVKMPDGWLYSFTVSSAVHVAEIPFADPLYRQRVNDNPRRHHADGKAQGLIPDGFSDELGFYKIQSITPLHSELVYDIEVEGAHSFIADGIVVHNSNIEKSMEMAFEYGILPLWADLSAQITPQLLNEPFFGERRKRGIAPDGQTIYAPLPTTVRLGFNTLDVRALQEDAFKAREAATNEFQWGGRMLKEYRAALGLPPVGNERDDWFYSDFAARAAGVPGSGVQATGGGKPQQPSGGGMADNPADNVAAALRDGQNSAQASK